MPVGGCDQGPLLQGGAGVRQVVNSLAPVKVPVDHAGRQRQAVAIREEKVGESRPPIPGAAGAAALPDSSAVAIAQGASPGTCCTSEPGIAPSLVCPIHRCILPSREYVAHAKKYEVSPGACMILLALTV